VKKALEDVPDLGALRQRPSVVFLAGTIFDRHKLRHRMASRRLFQFSRRVSRRPEIAIAGPASYLLSHLVFVIGIALIGPGCIRYGRAVMQWPCTRLHWR